MRCFLVCLALLASVAANVEPNLGYHDSVGIPLAAKIKAAEDEFMAKQAEAAKETNPLKDEDEVDAFDGRIVGGAVSATGAHPYLGGLIVDLLSGGQSACGSSLLSQNRLVTAAHCWRDNIRQGWRLTVVLGSNWLFHGGTRILTSQVVTHPQYRYVPSTLANDIAMIYLPSNVWYSNVIQPIALPSSSQLWEQFAGEWALAAGFGVTSDGQTSITTNTVISHVNLQVISASQCQAIWGQWSLPSNICTNGAGGVGICQGDSGGPLLVNHWGQNILVGVSSFVADVGCQRGFPSVFARVTSFYSFILQHM